MLYHLDTCTPDHFQGFSGHVYAVPLTSKTTYQDVFNELKSCINEEEIAYFEGNYATIANDCEGLRYTAKEQGLLSAIFCPGIEDDEQAETVYAYFGFKED